MTRTLPTGCLVAIAAAGAAAQFLDLAAEGKSWWAFVARYFLASDISSVIVLARSANSGKWAKADETSGRR